jgi:SAM-dependent methyltransferase
LTAHGLPQADSSVEHPHRNQLSGGTVVSRPDDHELGMGRPQLILAGKLSALGERLGVGWLTYNPIQMKIYHRYAVREAAGVISSFEEMFPQARRYVDVGCGSGAYAAEAVRRGHPTVGLERSRAGRRIARSQGVSCESFDLRDYEPSGDTAAFDLAYCFEVAEHLPPALGDSLVDALCGLAQKVVFSAAPPGQGGVGHINEHPPEYWQAKFAAKRFHHDPDASSALRDAFARNGVWAPWLKSNTGVYLGPTEVGGGARASGG